MRRLVLPFLVANALLASGTAAAADGFYGAVDGGGNNSRDQQVSGVETSYDSGVVGALSVGYRLRNGFRPELEFAHRENDNRADSPLQTEARAVMLNLWYDLRFPRFAQTVWPYAGLGAGSADVSLQGVDGPGATAFTASDRVNAWQAGVGLGWDMTPRLAFSLGYRYLETETSTLAPGLEAAYRSDSVLAGFRFAFGDRPRRIAQAEGPQVEAAAFETLVLQPVNFQFDMAELTGPAQSILDALADRLSQHPGLGVVIEGHTDAIGSDRYNMELGQRRADAVARYLVKRGVDRARLETLSRGETEPIADNTTPDGRATNRRAEFSAPRPPAQVKVVIEPPSAASIDAADDSHDPGR